MLMDLLVALLLIPHMGRKKYGMNQKQCGRNMLITDYLWIAYCESLPPGILPDPKMKRHRKQVSSHIQVLKGFFRHHPMCKLLAFLYLRPFIFRKLPCIMQLGGHPCVGCPI